MKLQEIINKFDNDSFLLTVDGLCEELRFSDIDDMKKHDYWKDYKNRKVKKMYIISTNYMPELCIKLEED